MSKGDNSPGISRLTRAIKNLGRDGRDAPVLDFGVIQQNGSLLTNTFPVPIPKNEYHICRQLRSKSIMIEIDGEQKYYRTNEPLQKGDRVLVAWVGSEAIVIDVIIQASRIF